MIWKEHLLKIELVIEIRMKFFTIFLKHWKIIMFLLYKWCSLKNILQCANHLSNNLTSVGPPWICYSNSESVTLEQTFLLSPDSVVCLCSRWDKQAKFIPGLCQWKPIMEALPQADWSIYILEQRGNSNKHLKSYWPRFKKLVPKISCLNPYLGK